MHPAPTRPRRPARAAPPRTPRPRAKLAGGHVEQGSISIWIATSGLVMIILVGLAVDLGGQVHAQQYARDIAAQAARAGGQQLQASLAVRGLAARADPGPAVAAARAYLTAADLTGTASLRGGDTVIVTTSATYDTKFLGLIGINQLTVTAAAESRIARTVGGVER
ncbi:pilus assembly protein TadG-related protein [Intrasporangium calvum]|uniref:Pilus assembly protein TadG-related protein n=1 Tax=Intrasporangium calvum TaxID=53358 RepID=A0ABT5GJ05_9MICO|nr:pilus assembly protein TadG-related protein [Intrasporangium calvum]MDC5698073.1 pilus assembly protein TadG-related protein [Intrasporangium calvum]